MRIGQGVDVHTFTDGDHITLGGVHIPHTHGLKAHSDGDVLIHALCDALLGALALGDIGHHFPDNDPAYKGIDSRILLRRVMEELRSRGFRVVNADMTILAESPRLAPHIDAMRAVLAGDMGVGLDRVNIKATTNEGMGYVGRREGILAYATVLVSQGAAGEGA
ncbi:MAG: 2-C-methyl-D-erythritol 2,4-cyclodiphosphate synthase [Gammaproteobacteria bacterium]|nr:2-C-methyl-D-erythritol 2,4-cyclodiphosphate synthase [Gammaproteobacteria bacterium]